LIRDITSLGEKEAKLLIALRSEGKTIFSFGDAVRVLKDRGRKSIAQILYALTKKRWLERLEKGKYLILPFEAGTERAYAAHEFIIAANLITPYYIGFRSALNYYGYTEQVSRTVYVVSAKQKRSVTIDETTFQFVKLSSRKRFGVTQVVIQGESINISDREKTIIDCLDHLEYAGGITEVAKGLWFGKEELDFEKLVGYAERLAMKSLVQRLSFLLELLELANPQLVGRLTQSSGKAYVKLDPLGGDRGKYLSRWRLRVNVAEPALTEWREH